jgi:hypothetical protein
VTVQGTDMMLGSIDQLDCLLLPFGDVPGDAASWLLFLNCFHNNIIILIVLKFKNKKVAG